MIRAVRRGIGDALVGVAFLVAPEAGAAVRAYEVGGWALRVVEARAGVAHLLMALAHRAFGRRRGCGGG
jgi:hypothetical protein